MKLRILTAVTLLLTLLPATAECAPHFVAAKTYRDARFGFRLAVPPGYAAMHGATDGDGIMFNSRDRLVRVRAWGSNNVGRFTAMAALQQQVANRRNIIKYQKAGPGWRESCWVRAGKVFFVKVYEGKGSSNSLMVSYPVNVPELAGKERSLEPGFKPGDLSKPH